MPCAPGYPEGRYEIPEGLQGELSATTPFTVTRASPPPKIRVFVPFVSAGQSVEVIMAGLSSGQQLYLYRLESALGEWKLLNRSLPLPDVNSSGKSTYFVTTSFKDDSRCLLAHTGFPETGAILPVDPRVFAVGTDPQHCK